MLASVGMLTIALVCLPSLTSARFWHVPTDFLSPPAAVETEKAAVKFDVAYKPAADPETIRQRFLSRIGNNSAYSWYKRYAVQLQQKKAAQRKPTSMHKTPDAVMKQVKQWEESAASHSDGSPSIPRVNKPLGDFLYQGDLLLSEIEAVEMNITQPIGAQRKAGGKVQLVGGKLGPDIPKWPHDAPICYEYHPQTSAYMKATAKEAFQFWTDNTCLEWKEGCQTKPIIKIFPGDGCYTNKGRLISGFRGSDPLFADEQPMSLQEPGCEFISTVAHEASHVMGMAHEQSRPDRDDFIDVVWSNIEESWKAQYDKADTSDTFKNEYDYGSNMQYTGYANDPKIDMAAKDKRFQHTMGNEYGPIFADIKIINQYNDCMCKSGLTCQNQGFPHPRDCNGKCICPEGFSGKTCTDRKEGENGAPAGCGATLDAKAEWQTVKVDVPAPQPAGPPSWPPQAQIAKKQACCNWWIKAPAGKTVELKFDEVKPGSQNECTNDCKYGGTEVKFGDLTRGGLRVCCKEHAAEVGTLTTTGEMAIIRVCSGRNTQAATIQYRTSDTPGECKDEHANCPLNAAKCENTKYSTVMKRRCHKTCKLC
jgi:hypothetical protein